MTDEESSEASLLCRYDGASATVTLESNGSIHKSAADSKQISEYEEKTTRSFKFKALSRQNKFILASSCLSDMLSYMCLSIMAPFFPEEAAVKGVNDAISGWIFGVFALTQVIMSPVFGALMPYIGSRFMYLAGIFLSGGCTVLFGLMTYIPVDNGPLVFISMCFLIRIVLAIGCTAQQTACFAILAKEFPDQITTVFGIAEVFVGLGFMTGPAIGGFLYGAGGFLLPFLVLGGIIVLSFPVNWLMMPQIDDEISDESSDSNTSIWTLLKCPSTIITSLAIVVAAMIWSIMDPTLEPHLREFNLSSEMVGVIFLVMSATYALSSPIWGWVADKIPDNRALLIPGFLVSAVGLLILGPTPLFGLSPDYNELWLNFIALIILGISGSAALIPTFDIYFDISERLGFQEDMSTYGAVAGLWGSMYALGDFVGPTAGGWLLDTVGFPWCVTYAAGACMLMVVVLSVHWFVEAKCMTRPEGEQGVDEETSETGDLEDTTEKTPLLGRRTPVPNRQTPVPNRLTPVSEDDNILASYPPMSLTESV